MKKVAIIEDEKACREDLRLALEDMGYEVLAIGNRPMPKKEKVEQQLKRFKPDVALLDHNLKADYTGQDLALGVLAELQVKAIGISSCFQDYVKLSFDEKRWLRRKPELEKSLGKLIETATK